MHPEDLKTIWVCSNCGRNFAFRSDAEDHVEQFNHSGMQSYDFSIKRKSRTLERFVQGNAKLNFKVDGKVASVFIDYKYYPSKDSISYIDVRYTDEKLQTMIENDPEMIKKINNYIRRLEQRQSRKESAS